MGDLGGDMASKISRAVALALSCASLNVPPLSALAGDAPAQPPRKWDPWAEIGGYASNRSYADRGEAALWVPLLQDGRSIFFTDIRGKLFDDDQHEGNVAIGYRFMGANGWNPGIWAGLDRRYTLFGNDFDQFSFGAELLSRDWDFRLNGYVPIDDAKAISGAAGASVVVTGGSIFLGSGGLEEVALWGVDYEVGYRIPLEVYGLDGRAPDPQGGP